VALLALRGNMNREAIREIVTSNGILESPEEPPSKQTIFTRVHEKTGPLASRFFQTVVAPRAAGFKTQTSNLNTSVNSTTGTSFSKISTNISTAVSNSPVYHAINQAWNEKDQISSKVARALDFGNADLPERTNPFGHDPREDKGPAPRPPSDSGSKGPAPKPPQKKKGPAPPPPVASTNPFSTNPFEFDED